jgi:hypothetical protein
VSEPRYTPEEPEQEDEGTVLDNAVSILEFLAWGKRKDQNYQDSVSPEANVMRQKVETGDVRDVPDGLEETSNIINILQLLLPNPRQVWQLVDYHETSLLWYHNSYYAPTFRKQLKVFYDRFSGCVVSNECKREVNLQWLALLFSILAGSMTCAPSSTTLFWGFKNSERNLLSKKWFRAAISSLNKGEYTAKHSLLSVQAISTLTISAHLLGNSNMHAIHLASAVRIAQGLGLHRLADDTHGDIIEIETGRRIWTQLCNQDWFSTSFYETYLINPLYSSTDLPRNCHDKDMKPLPEHTPTITSYCRFLTKVASIMPQLQDELVTCNTSYTKYDQVLKWDKHLRALVTAECPSCLSNCPFESDWPDYVPWARRALAISSSHKIIMIHRSFLSESFLNPAFEFTKRTCLAASKTIIKEYKSVVEENGPILWIHQAFSVAAAIILVLDILHRGDSEPEYTAHKVLAEDIVHLLNAADSMIALRGSKLLSALLFEVGRRANRSNINALPGDDACNRTGNKRRRLNKPALDGGQAVSPRRGLNVTAFIHLFCNEPQASTRPTVPSRNVETSKSNASDNIFSLADVGEAHKDLSPDVFYYPPQGLETATDFENLLYLASHDMLLG